jgi:hypothetical protein
MNGNIVNSTTDDSFASMGGIMSVKKCIKFGKKYYCHNKERQNVSVFTEYFYQLDECPEPVLINLMPGKKDALLVIDDKNTLMTDEEMSNLMKILNSPEEK